MDSVFPATSGTSLALPLVLQQTSSYLSPCSKQCHHHCVKEEQQQMVIMIMIMAMLLILAETDFDSDCDSERTMIMKMVLILIMMLKVIVDSQHLVENWGDGAASWWYYVSR